MESQIRRDEVTAKIGVLTLIQRMWPYLRSQKKLLALTLLTVLTMSFFARALPFIFGYAVDEGIKQKSMEALTFAALAYLFCEIAKGVTIFCYRYSFQKLGNRVLYHVRDHLIQHVQSLPTTYFNEQPTGRIVTRLTNDVHALGELFTGGVIMALAQMVTLVTIFFAMLFISPKLTLIVLLMVPFFIFGGFYLSRIVRRFLRLTKGKLAAINAFAAENLNGMQVIQLYSRVEKNTATFDSLSEDYRQLNMSVIKSYAMLWPTMSLFNAVTIALALYFGSLIRLEGDLPIGSLIAFFVLVQDFLHPLRNILERYIEFQNSLTSGERIFTLLEEPPESERGMASSSDTLLGHIQLRNLSFRYREDAEKALDDVTLEIQPGESIAVVGRTGSGKTTLVSLLQRFYDYEEGEIRIGDRPLKEIPRRDIRSKIGVVQQDGFTFRGSLSENISLGADWISEERLHRACEKVGLGPTIERLGGLEGLIEERGANLSVGERQLIAFARILAFEKDILILDEATANIDSRSEALIQQATKEITRDRTSLIIAHRLSTIRDCDRIVVLHQGKVDEVGSHDELMAQGGRYRQMIESQTS